MIVVNFNAFFLMLLLCCQQTAQMQRFCAEQGYLAEANQTLEISMINQKNQTGHWITHISAGKSSSRLPNNWKVNFKNSITQSGGIQFFNTLGTITVPPPRPVDYEFLPNIGYYKFYPEAKVTFDEALAKCSMDGAHLAIINSDAKYYAIRTIFSHHPKAGQVAFIGFHDRFKEGEYVTIFGQSLHNTGFVKWHPGDPNNYANNEHCGGLFRDSFLCDVGCEVKLPYFCEFDLSWGEF